MPTVGSVLRHREMVSDTTFAKMQKVLMHGVRTGFPESVSFPGLEHLGIRIAFLLPARQGITITVVD